ncbi:glycosyltransferase family 2 protein [Herbiconiux liangxiaofengii]|uniref:glycosyltransferase family 2 protein n=1 Tax=Herbiconiux liangxiaofengii TaxID=3342795 RepID=UPI0035B947FD
MSTRPPAAPPARTPATRIPPTISVVIPVRDDADGLRRCLAALARQTVRPLEIVVVDNGSSDDSAEVARAAGALVVDESEEGIPAASARGFDEARGDLVARLDADCVPRTDWLAGIARAFEERPHLVAVSGWAHFGDGPRLLRRSLAAVYLTAYTAFSSPGLGHPPLFGSNCAVRRDAWQAVSAEVHRHDPLVHDDLDLSVHLGALPAAAAGATGRYRRPGIRLDRRIGMTISMRPFADPRAFALRVRRGVHTLTVHRGRRGSDRLLPRPLLSRSPTALHADPQRGPERSGAVQA